MSQSSKGQRIEADTKPSDEVNAQSSDAYLMRISSRGIPGTRYHLCREGLVEGIALVSM